MEPTTNTVSAWHPTDYHGTTLYEMAEGPDDRPGYEMRLDGEMNTGVIFEISRAIKSARLRSNWLDERSRSTSTKTIRRVERDSKRTRYGLRPKTAVGRRNLYV